MKKSYIIFLSQLKYINPKLVCYNWQLKICSLDHDFIYWPYHLIWQKNLLTWSGIWEVTCPTTICSPLAIFIWFSLYQSTNHLPSSLLSKFSSIITKFLQLLHLFINFNRIPWWSCMRTCCVTGAMKTVET